MRSTIRHGRRVRSGAVVVHHVPQEGTRHAAVVAAKGVGDAVGRHRRQRQLRHILAGMWDELPPGSLVVRALPGSVSYSALEADVQRAVRRL